MIFVYSDVNTYVRNLRLSWVGATGPRCTVLNPRWFLLAPLKLRPSTLWRYTNLFIITIIILARTKTCFVRCGRLYMSSIKCLSYVVVCPMVHWAHVRVYHSTILSDDISTESAIVAGSWSWLTNTNHAITSVAIAHVLIITENYVLRPNYASRCIPVQLLPSYSHIVE